MPRVCRVRVGPSEDHSVEVARDVLIPRGARSAIASERQVVGGPRILVAVWKVGVAYLSIGSEPHKVDANVEHPPSQSAGVAEILQMLVTTEEIHNMDEKAEAPTRVRLSKVAGAAVGNWDC